MVSGWHSPIGGNNLAPSQPKARPGGAVSDSQTEFQSGNVTADVTLRIAIAGAICWSSERGYRCSLANIMEDQNDHENSRRCIPRGNARP